MTTVTLSKWGNAQGVRIPKNLREQLGLREGQKLEVDVKDGAIVLTPQATATKVIHPVDLKTLFADRSEPYAARDDAFGAPAGAEEW